METSGQAPAPVAASGRGAEILRAVVLALLLAASVWLWSLAEKEFFGSGKLDPARIRLIGFALVANLSALLAGTGYLLVGLIAALVRWVRRRGFQPARLALALLPLVAFLAAHAGSGTWLWQTYRHLAGK